MVSELDFSRRSKYCGQVTTEDIDHVLVLKGWVQNHRDHGGVYFVDLRDRTGLVQVVFDPEDLDAAAFEQATRLKYESVIAIKGRVRRRPEGTINPDLSTGEVEVMVMEWSLLSQADPLPFPVDEYTQVNEDLRLKYRYLDLRRPQMQKALRVRAKVAQVMRRVLDGHNFLEVETPVLTKSTPEGARDFLVPSRLNPGTFYALPQSPQLFKQLLMVSGYDRYYQIVKCFRDEDLRANRQPEFTQLDIEMSFVTPDELYEVMEELMTTIFGEVHGMKIETPFQRMPYSEAMSRYGSDKPDLRFGLELTDLTEIMQSGCEFGIFNKVIEAKGRVMAVCMPNGANLYSKGALKPDGDFNKRVQRECNVPGVAWFQVTGNGLESNITKFFSEDNQKRVIEATGAQPGDMVFMLANQMPAVADAAGKLRLLLARENNLVARFGLAVTDLTASVREGGCKFGSFTNVLDNAGLIRGLRVPGGVEFEDPAATEQGSGLQETVTRITGCHAVAIFAVQEDGSLKSWLNEHFPEALRGQIKVQTGAQPGDLLILLADRLPMIGDAINKLQNHLGRTHNLFKQDPMAFCWITDFPLLEWSPDDKRFYAMHHPFTMPHPEDWDKLDTDPGSVRSLAYDLALNGEEIGGGSIRIHRRDVQQRAFEALGIGPEEQQAKFAFLLDAFRFGPPPHGGIAFGMDRLTMILLGTDSIRDVIAFPKTQTGADLMVDAPGEVDDAQLKELSLKSTVKKKDIEASPVEG